MANTLLSTNVTTEVFAINNAAAQSRPKRSNQIKMLACTVACPPHNVKPSSAEAGEVCNLF